MFVHRSLKKVLLGVAFLTGSTLAALAAPPEASNPEAAAGTARVWFLRPSSFVSREAAGASPMIYANGTPFAAIPPNAAFYRDLAPGTYSFTVEPYGVPTGAADTVQLAPGTQTYLEVQWVPTWEEGYPSGGNGDQSRSFFVLNMLPQLADAYLPTLTYLGEN